VTGMRANFKFDRIENFGGERCAVILITLPSTRAMVRGARIVASGKGEIYRSLESGRTLKGTANVSLTASQTQSQNTPQGRATLSMDITGKYEISESEEIIPAGSP